MLDVHHEEEKIVDYRHLMTYNKNVIIKSRHRICNSSCGYLVEVLYMCLYVCVYHLNHGRSPAVVIQ